MFSDVVISTDFVKKDIPRELFPRDAFIYTQTMYIVGEGLAPPDCPSKMMDNINPFFPVFSSQFSYCYQSLDQSQGNGRVKTLPYMGFIF